MTKSGCTLFFSDSNFCGAAQYFHDFLFFDQESAHNTLADALMAEYTTVGSGDCLLAFRDAGTLQWTCWPDALQFLFTLAAFWDILALLDILVYQSAAWCTNTVVGNGKDKKWIKIHC